MLPKGLGNLANLPEMFKKVGEMKARMESMREELAHEMVEASVGGGMVSVEMNGTFQVLSVRIDPEIISPDEKEELETLVQAAVNEALRKVQELIQSKTSEITGGIDIPGLT